MSILFRCAAFGALLALSGTPAVRAQYVGPISSSSNKMPVQKPFRGTYFDPTKPGTGLFVDFGPNNAVFISYYSFDTEGAQTYYLIQAKYAPKVELDRARSGIIGNLADAVIYTTSGGEAVGGEWKQAAPHVENIPVDLVWTTPRRAILKLGEQRWDMQAVGFSGPDDNLLAGNWLLGLTYVAPASENVAQNQIVTTTVKLTKATFDGSKVTVTANSAPGIMPPPATAQIYLATCNELPSIRTCIPFESLLRGFTQNTNTPTLMAWFDPVSQHAGVELAFNVTANGAQLGPNNMHADLYLEPDRLQGNGVLQWTLNDPNTGRLGVGLYFFRVPEYLAYYAG